MPATINKYIIDHLHGYISAEESRKTNHLQSLTGFPRGKFGLVRKSGTAHFISLDELTKRGNPSAQQPSQPQRTQAGVNR
jgi:hypothetical protein